MTTTDHDFLDQVTAVLREAYDDPTGGDLDQLDPARARRIRDLLAEAHRRGITVRRIASHARLPGRWIIARTELTEQRVEAYTGEIHHLERELAAVRLDRARYVWALRHPGGPGVKGMDKTELAPLFGTSRPTIDAWLADAEASFTRTSDADA